MASALCRSKYTSQSSHSGTHFGFAGKRAESPFAGYQAQLSGPVHRTAHQVEAAVASTTTMQGAASAVGLAAAISDLVLAATGNGRSLGSLAQAQAAAS